MSGGREIVAKGTSGSLVRVERRDDAIVLLVFDAPGESVNTLRESFAEEFIELLEGLDQDESLQGVILSSGKKDNFIAGADISMLEGVSEADVAANLSRIGQRALSKLEQLRVPVVAAISGACLGGGLEIALAAHARVATDEAKTKLGLPEVQLGILPGLGGTQRLPRLIGLSAALDLLLTGKQIDARRALQLRLVDEVVPPALLIEAAVRRVQSLRAARSEEKSSLSFVKEIFDPNELRELAIAENPLGRKVVFDQAKKKIKETTRGNYPAPIHILDVVKLGLERGIQAGFRVEAEAFGQLVVSPESRALRHVFFAQQGVKKDSGVSGESSARPVERVGVIGAGLMGSGIALISAWQASRFVRIKELKDEGLRAGLVSIAQVLGERVERRRMTARERDEILARVTVTRDDSGLGAQDVIIEAVFEDLDLKRRILAQVESLEGSSTIFATNTSSIPLTQIARDAKFPERVVGMHYFSPVHKMPLLEVVVTDKTADWVTATAVQLGKNQGKTVIVVGDGPGFYTTRILGPYLNEAAYALLEGHRVEGIDAALVRAGFPVGPLTLLDEIGVDVGAKVSKTLYESLGERMKAPSQLTRLVEGGRLGRKSKRGFYDYSGGKKGKRPVDEDVYRELGVVPKIQETSDEIAQRCLLLLVNEAVHCLGEGILRSPRDGDIGAIFGLGFPPFLGGPFHYVDRQGAANLVQKLEVFRQRFGARFEPAPLLREHAARGTRFFP